MSVQISSSAAYRIGYCASACSPHYIKDKFQIEQVQRRFTKMIPELQNFNYVIRLKKRNLWTLEERRNRADILEVFKMFCRNSSVPFETFFQLDSNNRTRIHTAKIKKNRCRTDLRKHSFFEQME